MPKITVTSQYDFGDHVCRMSDPDKFLYVVIGLFIYRKEVMYQVRGEGGTFTLYDTELVPYSERLFTLN